MRKATLIAAALALSVSAASASPEPSSTISCTWSAPSGAIKVGFSLVWFPLPNGAIKTATTTNGVIKRYGADQLNDVFVVETDLDPAIVVVVMIEKNSEYRETYTINRKLGTFVSVGEGIDAAKRHLIVVLQGTCP